MIHRQLVNVYSHTSSEGQKGFTKTGNSVLPAVFSTGIRTDIVNFVHTNINKNRRQGHAVNYNAGMKHSAESWEQVELSPVSQESVDQEPADQVKVPSVTCVEKVECLPHSESGEDGTEEPTSDKEDMPLLLP